MELHHGCSENCTDTQCNECLKFFKPSNPNDKNCNNEKSFPTPTFSLIGFDGFKNVEKKITFTLYLRIKKGMMFNAKVSFYLVVFSSTGRRFLQEKYKGVGIQSNIAQGSYSENSYKSDFLAEFDCEANNVPSSSFKVEDLELIEVNGNPTLEDIPFENDSLAETDIANCVNTNVKNNYIGNDKSKVFNFIQNEKRTNSLLADYNEKRILISDPSKCTLSGNEGTVGIEGNVYRDEGIDETFALTTTDNKIANCILSKIENTANANLNCKIESPGRSFYLLEDQKKGSKGNYLSFSTNTDKTPLCNTYQSGDIIESSSSGGLSGGAIAGIVIVCFVIVAAIGLVLYFIYSGKGITAMIPPRERADENVQNNSSNPSISTSNEIGHFKE